MREKVIWDYMSPILREQYFACRIENSIAGSLPDFFFSTPFKLVFVESKILTPTNTFKLTATQFASFKKLAMNLPSQSFFFAFARGTRLPIYLHDAYSLYNNCEMTQKDKYVSIRVTRTWDYVICDKHDLLDFIKNIGAS